MVDPEYEPLDNVHLNTNGIIPVYPLTAGLTQDTLRKAIHDVINFYAPKVPEYLPENMRSSAHLADLPFALRNIHYPDSQESLKAAIDRLAFDEIFFLQLVCFNKKGTWQSLSAERFLLDDQVLELFIHQLPYSLTRAQQKVITRCVLTSHQAAR